jgi:NADPH-dependent curcumin reductase CurA
MIGTKNRQIILTQKPKGKLTLEHFELQENDVLAPQDGEILVRTILLSLDAANRAWMESATYRRQVMPGDVMHGYGIGEVVASQSDRFSVGDIVDCEVGWQDYALIKERHASKALDHRPLKDLYSVLGIAGLTAHHGLMQVGQPKAREMVVVSGAAGSVGTLVGQIAKAKGCHTIGIAGGPEKCAWLVDELGFDSAIDYKAGRVSRELRQKCPEGIDVYFDNVGGPILEAALQNMSNKGRIVCCGAVSQYDTDQASSPRGIPGSLVIKRLRMEGFIAMDFPEKDEAAFADLSALIKSGQLKVIEDIIDGLENAPSGLIGLLAGENRGKRMIRVAPDPA